MDKSWLNLLRCPATGGRLSLSPNQQELWCIAQQIAYPIEEGIPILRIDRSRALSKEECDENRF